MIYISLLFIIGYDSAKIIKKRSKIRQSYSEI